MPRRVGDDSDERDSAILVMECDLDRGNVGMVLGPNWNRTGVRRQKSLKGMSRGSLADTEIRVVERVVGRIGPRTKLHSCKYSIGTEE